MTSKDLILVEKVEDVDEGLSLFKALKKETIIVAVSAPAMYAFDQKGVEYVTPDEFFSPQEIAELGLQNFEILKDLKNKIDQLKINFCELNPIEIQFRRIKILMDSVRVVEEYISKLIEHYSPSVIHVFDAAEPLWDFDNFLLMNSETQVYTKMLLLGGFEVSVEAKESRFVHHEKRNDRINKYLKPFLLYFREKLKRLASPKKKDAIWSLGTYDHDMPNILGILSKKYSNHSLNYLTDSCVSFLNQSLYRKELDQLKQHPDYNQYKKLIFELEFFKNRANDRNEFESLFEKIFIEDHALSQLIYKYYLKKIGSHHVKAGFLVNSSTLTMAVLSKALKKNKRPVFFAQEGGQPGYWEQPIYNYCEMNLGDYLVSGGEGVRDYYQNQKETFSEMAECLPTGMLKLRRLRKRSHRKVSLEECKILYAPTTMPYHFIRYTHVYMEK